VGTKRFKSFSHSLVASLGLFELGSFVFLSLSVSVSLFLSRSLDRRVFLCFASYFSFFSCFWVVLCVCVLWAFLAFLFLGIDCSAVGF
jgi:hypothetical protein